MACHAIDYGFESRRDRFGWLLKRRREKIVNLLPKNLGGSNPSLATMKDIQNLKQAFDITEDAIRAYSESVYAASWMYNIEDTIRIAIDTNDRSVLSYFKSYQLSAMRTLLWFQYWVVYCNGEVILSKTITHNKWDSQVNPAD